MAEPRMTVRAKPGAVAAAMTDRGVSVRDLMVKVNDGRHKWSRGTIGNIRAAKHPVTVHPVLAERIAGALGCPYGFLFEQRWDTVYREVGPHGEREHAATHGNRRGAA